MTPEFENSVKAYTATTKNATNKITAKADEDAGITITVNGNSIDNGTAASWNAGENTVEITVSRAGMEDTVYTVAVTRE